MSKKSEKKVMTKDSRKRLQKDIVDIIKNPLTEHGIYYTHDDKYVKRICCNIWTK